MTLEPAIEEMLERHTPQLGANDAAFAQRVFADGVEKYADRLRAIGFVGKQHVLDAGCGFGQWTLALAGENKRVSACDISPARVAFLRDLAQETGFTNLEAHQSSIEAMPYEDNSFDAVFCYSAIYHTPWRQTLGEIARVLKPGGLCYISTNELGWYVFLWTEEYNKAADYDPRAKAARVLQDTLTYDRGGTVEAGNEVIITERALSAEMGALGFEEVAIADEGRLHLNPRAPKPVPFFRGQYYGLRGVYEGVARLRDSDGGLKEKHSHLRK